MAKYQMKLNLNVLNHLGLNLYSNTPAVLSEVIANSYDADATNIKISISQESDKIVIQDNGHGMSLQEINDKFLTVGYQKRENGESLSRNFKRPVMGRKGIGKLSLLSIANVIEIHSISKGMAGNALKLDKVELERQIKTSEGEYNPEEIEFIDFSELQGTKIIITDFPREIGRTESYLRPRLAKRFILTQGSNPFEIIINEKPLTIDDRQFYKKLEFLWPVGNFDIALLSKFKDINFQTKLNGKIDDDLKISGWIGSVNVPSDLKDGSDNNNKISIFSRGKLAQEDILAYYNEGGMYASYLIGEIHADFLDADDQKDIATTNRQQFNENDERFQKLVGHIQKLLKSIQASWSNLRNENSVEKALAEIPELRDWYNTQKGDNKKYAKTLFATIQNLHFDKDIKKKKEVYKFGILAFERLRVAERLSEIDNIGDNLDLFGRIFSEMQDIEATLYYDIASQRVEVINQLVQKVADNEKEKILQRHLFDNLWLLDPSWDRATTGTEHLEKTVKDEFGSITAKLTPEEQKGRMDIRYRNATNKHIIIELKRYVAGYKITTGTLLDQVQKYENALRKCLTAAGTNYPTIESICVVGKDALEDINGTNTTLRSSNARVITYDQLIAHAQASYQDYLDKNKEVGKIRELINKL
jgi:Histidine kinase-, DNA gyrase B-, and HSP90-like ATPase